jgi:hypothetical protein
LDSELKACIGCKLTISGERAEFHCPRNAYKALLTNPKVISKKVQGYWMFEQNNPKTRLRIIGTKDRYLEPKTLGIQGDRDLVLIDSPKGFPFSLTVANAGQRLMFGIDGGYFLLDRVKNRQ